VHEKEFREAIENG